MRVFGSVSTTTFVAMALFVTLCVTIAHGYTFNTKYIGIDQGWPQNPPEQFKHPFATTKNRGSSMNSNDPQFEYFKQYRDHFDPTDLNTFSQRFVVNDEYFFAYDKLSPVFLFIGAEGPLSTRWVKQGIMAEYGQKTGALLIALEHRYYGESIVTSDLSTPNLKYLTTYQALEDIAYFIQNYPHDNGNDLLSRPWIVYGGSYGGSLAAWARLKFPNLIAGAISSSGPFDPVIDFQDYLAVAQNAFEYYGGKECVDSLEKANRELYEQFFQPRRQDLLNNLTQRLNLCTPLSVNNTAIDTRSFFQSLTDSFMGIVQYNKENLPPSQTLNIKKVCNAINSSSSKLDTLIEVHNMVNGKDQCRPWDFNWQVQQLSDLTPGSQSAGRCWIYQTCTMFGFYQTNLGQVRAFGNYPLQQWGLSFFEQICTEAYGNDINFKNLEQLSNRFNSTMSAREWRASGVIFTNGNIDPWSSLSILDKNNQYLWNYSHFIPGTSHCATLYPTVDTDVPALTEARRLILQQLGSILQNFPYTRSK